MSQNELQLNAKEVVAAMEKIDLDIEEARRTQAGKSEILDTRQGSFVTVSFWYGRICGLVAD